MAYRGNRFVVQACDDDNGLTWDVFDQLRQQTHTQCIRTRSEARNMAATLNAYPQATREQCAAQQVM